MVSYDNNDSYVEPKSNTQRLTHEPLRGTRDAKDRYVDEVL